MPPRKESRSTSSSTVQATSSPGPPQVDSRIRRLELCSCRQEMRELFWEMLDFMHFLNAAITGVSLTDDETENTQGSRYCLVAIGRLQVPLFSALKSFSSTFE